MEKLLVILHKLREIRGRTRFQKIVFLLKEKDCINFRYNFIPYYYGPYSYDLQFDINILEAAGLIQVMPQNDILYVHSLTREGEIAAVKIEQKMSNAEKKKLFKALKGYKTRSTASLISEAKKMTKI